MAKEETMNIVQEALVKYIEDAFEDTENLPSLFERFCICANLLHSRFDSIVEDLLRRVRPGFKVITEEKISQEMWLDVVKKFKDCDVDFDTFCSLGTSGLMSGLSVTEVYESFLENEIVKNVDVENIAKNPVGFEEAIRIAGEAISRDIQVKAGEKLSTSLFDEDYTVLDDGTIASKKEVSDGVTVVTSYISKEKKKELGDDAPDVSHSAIINKEALFVKLMKSRKHMNEAVRVISDIINTEDFLVYASSIRTLVGFCPESSFTYSLLTGHLLFPPTLKYSDPIPAEIAVDQTSAAIVTELSKMPYFASLTLDLFKLLMLHEDRILEIICFSGDFFKDLSSLDENNTKEIVDKVSEFATKRFNKYIECSRLMKTDVEKFIKEFEVNSLMRLDVEVRNFVYFFKKIGVKNSEAWKFINKVFFSDDLSPRNRVLSLEAMIEMNCFIPGDIMLFVDMIAKNSDQQDMVFAVLCNIIDMPRKKNVDKDVQKAIVSMCEVYFRTMDALMAPMSKENSEKIMEFSKNAMKKKEERKQIFIKCADLPTEMDSMNHKIIEKSIDMFLDKEFLGFSTCCSLIPLMSCMSSSLLTLTKTFLFTAIIADNESGENDFDLLVIAKGVRDAILKNVEKLPRKIIIDIASLVEFCYLLSGDELIKEYSEEILGNSSEACKKTSET